MDQDNYIDSLRSEFLGLVEKYLTPVALRYGYSDVPLETNIKWRPIVLMLGNYSSGKSTLINELLGADVQATGQAPTDDSFTVITWGQPEADTDTVQVVEERDGKFLLNDPEYPFEGLKKYGQRFASHLRLKKVNSPFLENLAIIDTPGMLDSITERDRGYSYQNAIGEMARIADLVLILFDPHKAGTVRETYTSIRDTLPAHTFEDRILFVLNRIDECASLADLLQVYGTLCWNLSQSTGRKDIPVIHLTYSPKARAKSRTSDAGEDMRYLDLIENQQDNLKKAILRAPHHRLDNLATFIETHGERLTHMTEALFNYRRAWRKFVLKFGFLGFLGSLAIGAGAAFGIGTYLGMLDQVFFSSAGGGTALVLFFIWMTVVKKKFVARFLKKQLTDLDNLTGLDTQARKDSWNSVKDIVRAYLTKTGGVYSMSDVEYEYFSVKKVFERGTKEIREALNDLTAVRHYGMQPEDDGDEDSQELAYSSRPRFIKKPEEHQAEDGEG